MSKHLRVPTIISATLALLCIVAGCRGSDELPQPDSFPRTADPDAFIAFLNPSSGVPREGPVTDEIDNLADFPTAYYNTIDPTGTRSTLLDWKIQNGFVNPDGTAAECDPSDCREAHVRFRDTRDLGYGRNMFMRWNLATDDIAVFVENFLVEGVPGMPYGPLNLEAMVRGDRSWNFIVNAIEFSGYPDTSTGGLKFAKFFSYAGDGKRAPLASGLQQHRVDLDSRGEKPMPLACMVCHGGLGRTLVYEDSTGTPRLAPTIHAGIPGDLQAQLQAIDIDAMEFFDAPGFTRADNEAGIRLINAAVLSSYQYRQANFNRPGDWDPSLAIEIIEGRHGGNPLSTEAVPDANFVPVGWASSDPELYRSLFGPNCMVCHALRGSGLAQQPAFRTYQDLLDQAGRIDQLVFDRGLMPSSILNYWNFWDSGARDPGQLASAIGHSERLDEQMKAIPPGRPEAVIAAPPVATGTDVAGNRQFDIPVSGTGSAFADEASYHWSVEPAAGATVVSTQRPGEAILRVDTAGQYTLSLRVNGSDQPGSDTTSVSIRVLDSADSSAPLPAGELSFYGAGGINDTLNSLECTGCHSSRPPPFAGVALILVPCASDEINGYDFLYRSVLARVNFSSPLDSLFLRKPSNGPVDVLDRNGSITENYHFAGNLLESDRDYSTFLSWILNGAPKGERPQAPLVAGKAPACLP